jgi:hypothetical protein
MKPLLAVLALLLLVPIGGAQTLDADITLGSSFAGQLDDTADVDVLTFDTVKNTVLKVTVAGLKDKANKANPILLPQVEVVDLTTSSSLVVVASGKKKSAAKIVLPSTGEYLIRISATGGTSGPYKLNTKGALSKAGKVTKQISETAAGADFTMSFDADVGFLLNAVVKRAKKSLAQPGVMSLDGPSGPIDISASVITNEKKFSHKLKKFPLPEQGTYTLTSTNDAADAGGIQGLAKLKPTKPIKQKLVELDDEGGGVSIVRTISGIVQNSNDGSGLPGATITAGDMLMATTDGQGRFIVHDPPAGEIHVQVDGSTTSAMGEFHQLTVMTDVAIVGETVLPPVVLPDLSNPDSAKDDVAVTSGVTTGPIDATGGDENIALSGPAGTIVMINGMPATGSVSFSVTPVDPSQVPMPLIPSTGAVDAASYVTVGPANSTFNNGIEGGGTGLDIVLPNDRDFPVGTLVDVWSFDHDVEAWVNRSAETGQQGQVVATMNGTQIVASGVITAGGWHAPVVPIDTACATRIVGRVVDTAGQPVPAASIGTGTGQFATAGPDGVFSLESVTAYNVASLPTCVLEDVTVHVVTPVSYGAVSASVVVMGGGITAGGTTNIGDVVVSIPATGSLAGLLIDNGTPVMGAVDILDAFEGLLQAVSNENGSFFTAGLDAGSYTASYLFDGNSTPTTVDFSITANTLTTINLQNSRGGGAGAVTVLVLGALEDSGNPPAPIQGASVLLVGTDGSSLAGLAGTTDANGEAVFSNVDGPFTVTAQVDRVLDFGAGPATVRFAHTLVGIDPPSGVIGILSEYEVEDNSPTVDAMISGTITNMPKFGPGEFLSIQASGPNDFQNFVNVDLMTGTYAVPVPAGNDYRLVFNHAMVVGQAENRILSAQVVAGVDVPGAGNATVDINMTGPGVIAFDRQVAVDYTGLISGPCNQLLQVVLWPGDGDDINLATLVFDVGTLPDSVFLPSATDAALGGQRLSFLLEQFTCQGIDDGAVCDVFLDDNPATISLDLPEVPAFISPMLDDLINSGAAPTMTVSFQDVAAQGANGIVFLELVTEGPQQGVNVDVVVWELLLRAGTTSVPLPPTVLPMFGSGAGWEGCVGSETFEGFVFDYDAIFDGNIGNINALVDGMSDAFCESFAVTEFTVD